MRGDRRVPKTSLYLSNLRDPEALPYLVGFVSPSDRRCIRLHGSQGENRSGAVLTFSSPFILPVIGGNGVIFDSTALILNLQTRIHGYLSICPHRSRAKVSAPVCATSLISASVGQSVQPSSSRRSRLRPPPRGRHLAMGKDGLLLRESAQCPDEDEKAFQDVSKHR